MAGQMGKPAFAQANSTVGVFRLAAEGSELIRTPVRLGRSSVTRIEILEGLKEGDRVVLSDTSEWDDYERIRLH